MQLRPFPFRGLGRDRRNKIELKVAEARHALANEDYKQALVLGNELEKMRYLYASAVQAGAWRGLGRPDKGIEILQEAVRQNPKAWLLWLELGDMLAGARRFPEAYEAFDQAQRCPDVRPHLVDVHRAIALSKDGRHMEAIDLLADIYTDDDEIKLAAILAQVDIFNEQEGSDFVFSLVDRGMKIIAAHPDINYRTEAVRLHTAAGRACLLQNDLKGAMDNARRAIELRRGGCAQTLHLLRDIRGVCSKKAWYYQIRARGQTPPGSATGPVSNGPMRFETSYGVVADSAQEGLDFAREIEAIDVGPSLTLVGEEVVEPSPGALKGVYSFTDWIVQRA